MTVQEKINAFNVATEKNEKDNDKKELNDFRKANILRKKSYI